MKADPQVAPKKPYQQPVLKVHGNIEALTASVSNTANADGGTGGKFRTH